MWPTAFGGLCLLYVLYYFAKKTERAKVHLGAQPSSVARFVEHSELLKLPYKPLPIISISSIVHSLVGAKFLHTTITYERENLTTPDGGTISLDWVEDASFQSTTPIILLLPGFEGGSDAAYIKSFANAVRRSGWRPVVLNFRGYNQRLTSPRYHNIADTSDLRQAIARIGERYANAPLIAAGFSMGANHLMKFLGECGKSTPLLAGLSLSNPYDLHALATYHERRPAVVRITYNIQQRLSVIAIKRKIWRDRALFAGVPGLNLEHVMGATSMVQFSDRFSRVLYNYRTVDEYYQQASCVHFIDRICVPLLVLHAYDDPLVPRELVPVEQCERNPNIVLVTTQRGGHLAWLKANGGSWMSDIGMEFIAWVLNHREPKKV